MNLREMYNIIGKDNPIGYLLVAFQVIRTGIQQEAATEEGRCASFLSWMDLYKSCDNYQIEKWLDDILPLSTYNFPKPIIEYAISVMD